MGDRAQVGIKQRGETATIYLYTHWSGHEALQRFRDGLKTGEQSGRLDDDEYLARILFDALKQGDNNRTTGFGIGLQLHTDLSHPVPVIDVEKQEVTVLDKRGQKPIAQMSARAFASLKDKDLRRMDDEAHK